MIIKNGVILFAFAALVFLAGSVLFSLSNKNIESNPSVQSSFDTIIQSIQPTPIRIPTPTSRPLPDRYSIPQQLHVFQTFNNCGPATLSMALSYVGQNVSQQELGQQLRPYQIAAGDNDDKSVTLQEVADEAEKRGFVTYLRPNGTIESLKQLLAEDIVVVARTWLKVNEDIGHYRIIRGYDDVSKEIIQDDSLQGKNLRYSYNDFLAIWQPFNYEYLVIIPEEKRKIVEQILGKDLDERVAWGKAKTRIEKEIQIDPDNWHLTFALSRIHYYLGEYPSSVEVFNQVESKISFRTLWYQVEPILSIYETGDYDRVFQLTDKILNNQNRAYSELYMIRGEIYEKQGKRDAARNEYQKAVQYNTNKPIFREALERI